MNENAYIDGLLERRSVKVRQLVDPAPEGEVLEKLLTAAVRVPDHGKLTPWRLLLLEKEGQQALGDLFAKRFSEIHPDANDKQIAFERARPQRAPLLVAVVSSPKLGKVPFWEQQLSAGAVCMNLLHAAQAFGFAGQWLTEWPAFDAEITTALCEEEGAQIAGFIYLGTSTEKPEERLRPDLTEVAMRWPR